jgi:tRNA-specific 2-thiouridylase
VKKFLQENLTSQPGETRLLPPYDPSVSWEERLAASVRVGEHPGAIYFTVGERAGNIIDNKRYATLRGRTDVPPTFVVAKDVAAKILYVTDATDDPNLASDTAYLEGWQWTAPQYGGQQLSFVDTMKGLSAQIRYQQEPIGIEGLKRLDDERVEVVFSAPVKAMAEGQFLVAYDGEEVAGGGVLCGIRR